MKVLIVDDVGYVRHFLETLLKGEGIRCVTAASGQQALDALRRDPTISIVLTDLIMQGMDGLELFRMARRLDRLNDQGLTDPPRFLLMTALRPSHDPQRRESSLLQQALDLGFEAVLHKPIDRLQLLQHLRRVSAPPPTGTKGTPAADQRVNPQGLEEFRRLLEILLTSRDPLLLKTLAEDLREFGNRCTAKLETVRAAVPVPDPLVGVSDPLARLTSELMQTENPAQALAMCAALELKLQQIREQIQSPGAAESSRGAPAQLPTVGAGVGAS